MKRTGLVVTLVFAVLAFVCGFGGVSAALFVTQPSAHVHVAVQFTVNQGDTTTVVADNLQKAGLIRNALAFKLLAKVRGATFQAGVYTLYPDMTMDAIIAALEQAGQAPQIAVTIIPGLRVTQYPALFSKFPNFKASDFLKIATSGTFLDGTSVTKQFWFVMPLRKSAGAVYALEGYLRPDTYDFYTSDDATAVITVFLTEFGYSLCPGSATYLTSETACKAHATQISGKSIFTLMEQKYGTTNDQLALYEALTLASIVEREVTQSVPDIKGVTDVLYNRYMVSQNRYPNPPADDPASLGADPTAQYARDTDHPPANGDWWAPLNGNAATIDPNSPYNTDNTAHAGLPPGPISAPEWTNHMPDAIDPSTTQYFYYWASCQGTTNKIFYAATSVQEQQDWATNPPKTC